MLIGFGCTVPAVMATRTLSSDRDRKMTIMLVPFISCSAKIPIYAVFTAAFFPEYAALAMILLYVTGIIVGIIMAFVLNHTGFKGNSIPFVMELPNGFQTIIGEGGASLSGGEKQRISIARSILKNAPIIILDEATASIDSDNESYIQEAIDALVNGKILLVIAHRLNTIKNANQILVLDEGKITEHGTHEELIIQDGLYRCLWSSQQNTGTWKIK